MIDRLTKVRDYYTAKLTEHGATAKGLDWKDAESHQLRFDVLARILPGEPFTANDLGCGYGAMFEYLKRYPITSFTGVDISELMIAKARELCPDGRFLVSDTLPDVADYSFASGVFNVKLDTPDDEWRAWMLKQIDMLWEHSRKGMAFNVLSSYVDWRLPHLYYCDPLTVFDYCKQFSRFVTLRHDYPLYEWTMYATRDARS
jgi:SAM-dependent methyltransferase